jgi:hypothetical protein
MVSYASALRRAGLRPTLRHPWAVVGRTRRRQGWKLHLSSVQAQAGDLLARVVPILRDARVSFKVAQHDGILGQLNEGDLGSTQVGKFLTVYPDSDAIARQLAERLVRETAAFSGPDVVTDLPLGSVVSARYGSFSPVIQTNRLGYRVAMIAAGDGTLVPDRYAVPFEAPPHVSNPFELMRVDPAEPRLDAEPRANGLIGPGYLVVKTLKLRAAGGVLLAIDLRSRDAVGMKIVKFGRRHTMSDAEGRDIRDRLKRQAELHAALSRHVDVPAADPYFEDAHHGYAAFEHLEGSNLEQLRGRAGSEPWQRLGPRKQRTLLRRMADAIALTGRLHDAGYVHRDLSPSNFWVAPGGRVYLLDLELAFRVGDSGVPFGLGTEGFMSPQQAARQMPSMADDVFALGCVLTFILVGVDPRRILFSEDRHRAARLARMAQGVRAPLLDGICRALDPDEGRRPHLAELQELVARSARDAVAIAPGAALPPPFSIAARAEGRRRSERRRMLGDLVRRGRDSMLAEAAKRGGLWLSSRSGAHEDESAGVYEIERHANRGVAGVVYTLARLSRYGHGNLATTRAVRRAVRWLLANEPPRADRIPGLHFGEAGVAVAVSEAIAAGCLQRTAPVDAFLRRSLTGVLDWPDVTHGAAGQGIAALYCADRLGDRRLREHAHACAAFLVGSQAADGSWTLPPGIEGLSGETLTGFAHGTAGIAWFLAEYAERFGDRRASQSVSAAQAWLLARAVSTDGGERLEWPYGTDTRRRWHWWCHGGPGIALLFLKLYRRTGRRRDADVARRALRAHAPHVRHPNLTLCHGMSGLGEI